MSNVPVITINDQKVPRSFIGLVYSRYCKRDPDMLADCFWKARNATGENGIVRYVKAGLKKGATGLRWALLASPERSNGQMNTIRAWWYDILARNRRTTEPIMPDLARSRDDASTKQPTEPSSLSDILSTMFK